MKYENKLVRNYREFVSQKILRHSDENTLVFKTGGKYPEYLKMSTIYIHLTPKNTMKIINTMEFKLIIIRSKMLLETYNKLDYTFSHHFNILIAWEFQKDNEITSKINTIL